jgi:molybdate transport system substrate-binding protein
MSLRQAMVDVGQAYQEAGDGHVVFNFGGSNSLARQIIEGAPIDVFVSADEAQMRAAEAAGTIAAGTRIDLLSNQLVVVVPAERPVRFSTIRELTGPAFKRIALGDTSAVPVGVYAKAYLESHGLWTPLAPKVVPVTSVRAALGAVENGGADAAIVYRTDAALSSRVAVAFEVPIDDGPPIRYVAAVTRAAKQPGSARTFLEYLAGPEARALFERGGFIVLVPLDGGH